MSPSSELLSVLAARLLADQEGAERPGRGGEAAPERWQQCYVASLLASIAQYGPFAGPEFTQVRAPLLCLLCACLPLRACVCAVATCA